MSRRKNSNDIDAASWLKGEIAAGRVSRSLTMDQLRGVAAIVRSCDGVANGAGSHGHPGLSKSRVKVSGMAGVGQAPAIKPFTRTTTGDLQYGNHKDT